MMGKPSSLSFCCLVVALVAIVIWPLRVSAQIDIAQTTRDLVDVNHEPAKASGPVLKPDAESADSVKQIPLTADWTWRQRMAERGIDFNIRYVAQGASNEHGYRGTGTTVVQHMDVGATLNLAKLGVAEDGTVRIVLSRRVGSTLQKYTGSYIQSQAYYGQGQNLRLDEISYERKFVDQRLSFKGGFYSMGNEFAGLPYVCNFSANGLCGHPLGLGHDSGWVNSPTGQWGMRLRWDDPQGWYTALGAYDVTPLRKQHDYGFDLGFPGTTTGAIFPFEIGYSHGKALADYGGTYRFGGYYDSSRVDRIGAPEERVKGRYGFHAQAAQQIWKAEPNTVRGIALFAVANLTDARSGEFRHYHEFGANWRGPFSARPDDILGLGWAQVGLNPRLRAQQQRDGLSQQRNEQLFELNYSIQAAPWLMLRPTVQYLVHPGGYDERPDSLVYLMHVQITL